MHDFRGNQLSMDFHARSVSVGLVRVEGLSAF